MKKRPPIPCSLASFFHRAAASLRQCRTAVESLLFPWSCPGCADPVPYPDVICAPCASGLPRIQAPLCKRCGSPIPELWRVRVCPDCRATRSPLSRVRSCYLYEGLVRQMIRDAKFHRHARLLRRFSGDMYVLSRAEFPSRIEAVVPVPLHREREWERTFNQAELMARDLSLWWGIPLWTGLWRIQRTPAQSGLSGAARRRNLKDAFVVPRDGVPGTILLVDDVITTGATLEACARALRRKGARRVYAVTIARAVLRRGTPKSRIPP